MGKNDFLTPKAIANRIKAKGLQKLRWYCQMCQKQCRDENGFKCHCMSESHQRQMQVFGQNAGRFIGGFSKEFEDTFMEHMKRAHRFSRVAATVVYNEYIHDRHHIHMNSTRWTSLTEFVKYLGKAGKCKVEDTPKGWFITYIDRESETIMKENLLKKRERAEMAEELRHEKELEMQRERAVKHAKHPEASEPEEVRLLERDEGTEEKIVFALPKQSKLAENAVKKEHSSKEESDKAVVPSDFFSDDLNDNSEVKDRIKDSINVPTGSSRKSETGKSGVLDELMKEQEEAKERRNRKDYWITEDIIVKVMSKNLKEKGYYKQKGTILKVIGKYVAEIEMLESKHVLRVDQAELETVLPQIGGLVRVVNGAYRGSIAKLLGIDTEKFSAKIQVQGGAYDRRVLQGVQYEDICKLAVQK